MTKFWCVGDWGQENRFQKQLVPLLLHQDKGDIQHNKDTPQSTILALGDNFYMDGVSSTADSQWITTWWIPLQSKLLLPWICALGNHDFHQNPDAQIQFSHQFPESLWYMPHRYYLYSPPQTDNVKIYILVLDTVSLCPDTSLRFQSVQIQYLQNPDTQWEWIQHTLDHLYNIRRDSKTPICVMIMGHYPIFSLGHHGNTPELYRLWQLMKDYDVHAYLSGHDHSSTMEIKDNILLLGSSAISFTYPSIPSELRLSTRNSFYYSHPLHSVWSIDIVDVREYREDVKNLIYSNSFTMEINLWSLQNDKTDIVSPLFHYKFSP
uniref:Calcineurin-like phosphoesterase domain-containing protein n=1 Tax=viral metagenome TaxID=1070528 RepID=A0A6C0D1T8_9ZZZZ